VQKVSRVATLPPVPLFSLPLAIIVVFGSTGFQEYFSLYVET
jgi:hypothetical protein